MRETLSFHITGLFRDFAGYTNRELKKLGLRFGQLPFIVYTGKYPGCTQAELTRALGLDWGYSQRTVGKLTEGGFLQKEYRRERAGNCLTLTETGNRAFEVCHQVFEDWDLSRAGALTGEERETLKTLLSRLTADLQEGPLYQQRSNET